MFNLQFPIGLLLELLAETMHMDVAILERVHWELILLLSDWALLKYYTTSCVLTATHTSINHGSTWYWLRTLDPMRLISTPPILTLMTVL